MWVGKDEQEKARTEKWCDLLEGIFSTMVQVGMFALLFVLWPELPSTFEHSTHLLTYFSTCLNNISMQ